LLRRVALTDELERPRHGKPEEPPMPEDVSGPVVDLKETGA